VGLSLCPQAYIGNYVSKLHRIFIAHCCAVALSSSGGVAVCYILPVLWVMSCFLIMDLMVQAGQIGCNLKILTREWHRFVPSML